ncbi:phage tail sheath family protein [Methanosarcina sp.]|uniref:phage tail sheath family protein n=1 Tax=Methanosarcina sp. TaxID=2213 RepID=UPI003C7200F7
MPEYLSPGVYIEEFEIGAKPMEGVSTSTAGFLGETERGPTTPCLITSWLQYQRVYGGYFGNDKYLPGSVDGFFKNGGKRCYIGRIVKSGGNPATPAKSNLIVEGENALTVEAVGEGKWGTRIALKLSKGTFSGFRLDVFYWKTAPASLYNPYTDTKTQPRPAVSEIFDNLSISEESPDYFGKAVNGISNLIKIPVQEGDCPELLNTLEASSELQYLEGGSDGEGNLETSDYERSTPADDVPGKRKGLTACKEIEDISIVYAPNAYAVSGLVSALVTHCELLKYRFAILDSPEGVLDVAKWEPRKDPTAYAAFYYPWIKVINPETGMLQLMPPGGYVAGIYARSDTERGVHKAPANEIVRGASDLQFQIMKGEQDGMNPRGVNVIRAFPGRGIRVWGARTLSDNTLWKYINVRRLFIYVEASIEKGTQWVVFEPNDDRLWARVNATITQFLTGVWKSGALMGTTPEEAFFVKCDRSTMTQDDIDNGRLICIIGIAPVKPAEFVIFRIAQWQGGSAATE